MAPAQLEARKLVHLESILSGYESALVAFSGGVDSTFLLKVASETLGERCHALTCVSVTMARSERRAAVSIGSELGLGTRHHVIESDELSQPGFADNPIDRCAKCKTELMDIAEPIARELALGAVVLGTNVDDLGDYRPGIEAASGRGARAPMVEAGLTKADVRALSRHLGLETWAKPQLACLSSRFPYGTEITKERLERIDQFEDGLRELGFLQLRVRFHDEIARLELPEDTLDRALVPETRRAIIALGKKLGFGYVALDLEGFRSGSLNETLVPLGRRGPQT